MSEFKQNINKFYNKFGMAKKMVLATCKDNYVTARMMSCVLIDGALYFQTDKKFLKYKQITANPLVALCIDNMQIEGIANELGHPLNSENSFFADEFKKHYEGSFNAYSSLPDEVLIKIIPRKITLWEYRDGNPYRVYFNVSKQEYSVEPYTGQ